MKKKSKLTVEFDPKFKMPDDPEARKFLEAFIEAVSMMDEDDMAVAEDLGEIDLGGEFGTAEFHRVESSGKTKH